MSLFMVDSTVLFMVFTRQDKPTREGPRRTGPSRRATTDPGGYFMDTHTTPHHYGHYYYLGTEFEYYLGTGFRDCLFPSPNTARAA